MLTNLILSVAAQATSIIFNRPGMADGSYSVLVKSIQLETSFGYSNTSGINYIPFALVRAPVTKRNEMRLTYNYVPQSTPCIEYDNNNRVNAISIGNKIMLMNEKGWLLDLAENLKRGAKE